MKADLQLVIPKTIPNSQSPNNHKDTLNNKRTSKVKIERSKREKEMNYQMSMINQV